MEINKIITTFNFNEKINPAYLEKNAINQVTEESINKVGLVDMLNVTIVDIIETEVTENDSDKIIGYNYKVHLTILHKGYNSLFVFNENLPQEEVTRIINLTK